MILVNLQQGVFKAVREGFFMLAEQNNDYIET